MTNIGLGHNYNSYTMLRQLLICILLLSITCRLKDQIEELTVRGLKRIPHKLGDVIYHKDHSEDSTETVLLQTGNPVESPDTYEALMGNVLHYTSVNKSKQILACSKGKKAEFFKFGAEYVGYIGNKSDVETIELIQHEDDCFGNVTVTFTKLKKNAVNSVQLQVRASNPIRGKRCSDAFVLGTAAKLHVTSFVLKKYHKFVWKNLNEVEYDNILTWGIHVFRLCDSMIHWFPDLLDTLGVFVGGLGTNPKIPFFGSKPPKYQQKLNVDFIEAGTGYRWKERKPVFTNLSDYEVKSGDFVAITRLDGIDQIIQYGAGSHAGHSALILEIDGVMSVVESQDGWYWPKHGIQQNSWAQWKKWALNADFNVAILPLSEESRKKFNVTAAVQFFKQMQGFPYGYHNFLFGWIDTPDKNYPPLLDSYLVAVVFGYIERLYELPMRMILTEGLNMRLKTKGLSIAEIGIEVTRRGMTFQDLMAEVEKDGWWYSDGYSYVCSAFVAAVYKAGGLLPEIEATQFTPKDVYTLTIYDANYKVPEKCLKNDPSLPYCQVMGSHLMELPGYATIAYYPHMAEHCPTMTPDFYRPDGC